ncbi:AAA family ATPase [Serratia rubidaea]|uniref:AAA family ATPase n=1 Tax=Serratia rubidaea TaxID=61652 RepID=UPI0022B92858|nr:AAA family ATPase [Serratia rubidaea]WBF43962.1 AAA family ATPase [Serratia rubidaea]
MNDNKGLNAVSRNASKGDVQSLYQLYINEYNDNKENKTYTYPILNEISSKANDGEFILREVVFNNFRGLSNLTLRLDDQITVIIGNNGVGKSSILDGISITLSWLKSNILREDRPGRDIKELDINNNANLSSITSRISFANSTFPFMIANSKQGSKERITNDLLHVKTLAGIYRHSNEFNQQINLPLLSYYSIHRADEASTGFDGKNKKNKKRVSSNWTKLGAYEETGFNRQDFDGFIEWLKFIYVSSRENSIDNKVSMINRLQSEINGALDVIRHLPEGFEHIVEPLKLEISIKEKRIVDIKSDLGLNNQEYAQRLINGVVDSFLKFLPNLDKINFKFVKDSLVVSFIKNGVELSPSQLSQGEKSLLTLIGDIAKRLVLLNPSLDNPLCGKGIVLIDEIDLHLHPGWQQIIIENLIETFPNIQFVISTHSPQVLSTVPKKCIRILKEECNEFSGMKELIAVSPKFQTKGVMSADVLSIIMGIDPTPSVDEADWLYEYKELIELGKYQTQRGLELKKMLLNHFGEDHPLIMECNNIIALQEIKNKIAERKGKV